MAPSDNPWLIRGITERLIELHALSGKQQLSMHRIAEKLNAEFAVRLTRNSIIGRSRRLSLAPRPSGTPRVETPAPRRRPSRGVDAPIQPPPASRHTGRGLTIYQLRDGDCKWPLDPVHAYPPFTFCGESAEIGQPYCWHHYQRGHVVPRKTWV